MLINTVILLLRDGLPIVFMLVLLLSSMKHNLAKQRLTLWLRNSLFISMVVVTIQLIFIDEIAHWYDGMGIELLFSISFVGIYLFMLSYLFVNTLSKQSKVQQQKLTQYSATGIFVLVFSVNTINFLVYLVGFWSQTQLLVSIFIGMLLGVGICISVGILLYFILQLNKPRSQRRLNNILLLVFACGQLTQAIHLLLQMDFLPSAMTLWDSSALINESSELGYFMTALVGYDARPTTLHLSLYLLALLLPMAFYYLKKHRFSITSHQEHN